MFAAGLEMLLEVGTDESILVAEMGVQGGLGHARLFQQPVDADHVYALGIEQPAGDVEQTLARARLANRGRRRTCLRGS
jgi:hypothetical protein